MNSITPNKEIIRRICLLNGGTTCYIAHRKGKQYIEVLSDIKEENLEQFSKELSEWSGVNYKVHSMENKNSEGKLLNHINNKILPIQI